MAPFIGPDKQRVMNILQHHRGGPLSVTLGRYMPQFVIELSATQLVLLPLVLDQAKVEQAALERQTEEYYVPEMDWQFLLPGAPLIRESNLQSFILQLQSWSGWEDL